METTIALIGAFLAVTGALIALGGQVHASNALAIPFLSKEGLKRMKEKTKAGNRISFFGTIVMIVGALVLLLGPGVYTAWYG